METWAVALALAQSSTDADTANGVDRSLIRNFPETKTIELEGVFAQLSMFDALPLTEQRDLLTAVLSDAFDESAHFEELINSWQAGDVDALEVQAMRGILADPELYDALLAKRNRTWTAQISNLLSAQDKPLIAVGAGHMLGDDGLPAMLSENGYTVTRIQ